jgi:hypothetical protein
MGGFPPDPVSLLYGTIHVFLLPITLSFRTLTADLELVQATGQVSADTVGLCGDATQEHVLGELGAFPCTHCLVVDLDGAWSTTMPGDFM